MKRERRREILRDAKRYAARLIEEAVHGTSGLFEGLETEEEYEVARNAMRRLADGIRARSGVER